MYVLNFALKMEKIGKKYYEELARETTVTGIKNIFRMLASDQQELYDTFVSMKNKVGAPMLVNSDVLDRGRDIFTKIFSDDHTAVNTLKSDLDAYQYALEIEAQIVNFFEQMARRETNQEAKAALMEVLEEERKLYDEIENIWEFVAAPKSYLANMEFSNLKEI